jgi:PAS domain S-box-containing protein
MLVTRLDDGRIVEVNPAFETMVGYSRVEAIGRTTLELRLWEHDEDRERFLAAMREEGFVQQRECRFRTKPGDIMTGLLSARPFQLDGEWLLLGCVSDITARKTEEEQLAAAHRKMRLTAQAAHVGFWSLDVRTQAIEWDDEILRIYGITRERFDQTPTQTLWLGMLHPDDRARFHTEAFLPSEHQDEVRWEFRIVRPDGEVRQVETRCAVLRDAQGKPLQMLGLNYDLTDIRRVESALRETNAYLDNLLNHANAPIIVWDPQYRITRFNHAFEQLTGYREPEVAGHVLTLLFPPEQIEASMALIRETTMGQRWESVEIAIQRRDGTVRTVLWNSATVLAEDGQTPQATIAQGQDITERKQAEAKLAAAKAQAESANRAKSQFLAHMSHEIRTPMNGVLGLAQLLEQEPLAHEQREMVRQIREAGRLLLGIINDILDFSKIEAGQLQLERQPFDLTESLTKVLRIMAAPAEAKGLALRLEPVALAGVWLGDALRLEQMLFNLIGNAIKFTATGEVVIHVRPAESRDPDRTWFRFEVRDTGIGLTPEAQERLFAPFVQADGSITRRFGGTGLGLSICKRLAELMGGAIGVGSTPGQGSVFWFELPFERAADGVMAASVAATVTPVGPAPPGGAGPRLTGSRVLVVDDNHINRLVIERALRREGVVVTLAVDGQQALDCLKASAGAFDAVLMDIQMPVLDGLAATRALRKDPGLARLPVIALTAGVTTEEREAALSAGLDDFLAKPVDLTLMLALLSRYAGREPGQARPATRDGAG